MRKSVPIRPVWFRAERPYLGETLVLMVEQISGRQALLCVNQWGETRTPLQDQGMQKHIQSMRQELGV